MAKKKKPPTQKEYRKAAGVIADGIIEQQKQFFFPAVITIWEDGKKDPALQFPISHTASPYPALQLMYRRYQGKPVLALFLDPSPPTSPPYILHPEKKYTMEFNLQK